MVATIISVVSLLVSITTAWLTLFRRGTVKMTQPTVIFFGPDTPRSKRDGPLPKVFLRALLFATAKRGRIIQSLHVALSRNETHQNFNIWVYGNDKLVRGSGLLVGETGVEANHHFLAPRDAGSFSLQRGSIGLRYSLASWVIESNSACSPKRSTSRGRLPLRSRSRAPASILIGGQTHRFTRRMSKSGGLRLIRETS